MEQSISPSPDFNKNTEQTSVGFDGPDLTRRENTFLRYCNLESSQIADIAKSVKRSFTP